MSVPEPGGGLVVPVRPAPVIVWTKILPAPPPPPPAFELPVAPAVAPIPPAAPLPPAPPLLRAAPPAAGVVLRAPFAPFAPAVAPLPPAPPPPPFATTIPLTSTTGASSK